MKDEECGSESVSYVVREGYEWWTSVSFHNHERVNRLAKDEVSGLSFVASTPGKVRDSWIPSAIHYAVHAYSNIGCSSALLVITSDCLVPNFRSFGWPLAQDYWDHGIAFSDWQHRDHCMLAATSPLLWLAVTNIA